MKKIVFMLFLILTVSQFNFGQIAKSQVSERKILSRIKNADRSDFRYIPKKPGHYTKEDWRKVIDSTWGEGLSTAKKLVIFDRFWYDVDRGYPSFYNLNVNWDSLKSVYRPEVEAGVSRGRFNAIMCRMSAALSDTHTGIQDVPVSTDSLKPGTPLFVVSGYQSMFDRDFLSEKYCHFGASLSPMPDSSLLVYDVVPNHPLGLEKGDIVLGYDGIPWKKLYKELLDDELPFRAYWTPGSNSESVTYLLLTSAGENWHLFDTIDIVKYNSGDTLHLPTSLLQNKKMELLTTSQLPVPGVPFPDIDNGHWVSWGVIDGTSIGYIYVWNWTVNGDYPYPTTSTGDDFRNAIQYLIDDYKITGLIIDSRYNTGGQTDQYPKGLSILFNEDQDIFQWFIRNNSDDHYSMSLNSIQNFLKISSDRYLFDKPIALLTGPFSKSCGDFMPLQMRYHPMVRTFGLSTNGAYGLVENIDLSYISSDWAYSLTSANTKLKENPGKYLTHLYIPPDEEVWFTKESVVKGEDDVVNAALNWITNLVYGHSLIKNISYCHAGVDTLKISALVENPNSHQTSSKVYFKNLSGSYLDSIQLTKSGLSGKSEIWTGNYLAPDSEDFYSISLSAKDITDSKTWTTDNISRFTTAGPLKVDSVSYSKNTSSQYFSFIPWVKNEGNSMTVKNAKISLYCNDPWVKSVSTGSSLPDIEPGAVVNSSSHTLYFYIDSLLPNPEYFNIRVEITSNGALYWTDSMEVITSPSVAVDEQTSQPLTFKIEQNYPNPFNPSTKIDFTIPNSSLVNLTVYDVLGEKVATLLDEEKLAGKYEVEFNGSNLSSGLYLYQLKAGDYSEVKKMILLK